MLQRCHKVHEVYATRTVTVSVYHRNGDVTEEKLPMRMYARIGASVDPVRLIEMATLARCKKDGTPTGAVYCNVPYSALWLS